MLHIFNKTWPLSAFPEDGYVQYVNQNILEYLVYGINYAVSWNKSYLYPIHCMEDILSLMLPILN